MATPSRADVNRDTVTRAITERLEEWVGRADEIDDEPIRETLPVFEAPATGESEFDTEDLFETASQATESWLAKNAETVRETVLMVSIRLILIECTSPYREADAEAVRTTVAPVAPEQSSSRGWFEKDARARLGEQARRWFDLARETGATAAHEWLIARVISKHAADGEQPSPRDNVRTRFARALLPAIRRQVIARVGPSRRDLVDDLVQESWCVLLGPSGICQWRPRGKRLTGFIRMLTDRTVSNKRREPQAAKRGGGAMHFSFDTISPLLEAKARSAEDAVADIAGFLIWLGKRDRIEQLAGFLFLSGWSPAATTQRLALTRRQVDVLWSLFEAYWHAVDA